MEDDILPDKPREYKPCPECDGWLAAPKREIREMAGRYFKDAQIWRCTICPNKQTVPARLTTDIDDV